MWQVASYLHTDRVSMWGYLVLKSLKWQFLWKYNYPAVLEPLCVFLFKCSRHFVLTLVCRPWILLYQIYSWAFVCMLLHLERWFTFIGHSNFNQMFQPVTPVIRAFCKMHFTKTKCEEGLTIKQCFNCHWLVLHTDKYICFYHFCYKLVSVQSEAGERFEQLHKFDYLDCFLFVSKRRTLCFLNIVRYL